MLRVRGARPLWVNNPLLDIFPPIFYFFPPFSLFLPTCFTAWGFANTRLLIKHPCLRQAEPSGSGGVEQGLLGLRTPM